MKKFGDIPTSFHYVRTQQESSSYEPGRGPSPKGIHADTLTLDFPTSRTVNNNFLLLVSHQSVILLQQPGQTKTVIFPFSLDCLSKYLRVGSEIFSIYA